MRRSEFLTPVWGTPSSDHGRNQAWFEFTSQLGELIGMDFVGLPVYSWGCAAGFAVRMAARLTGRLHVLVPDTTSPERLAVIRTYCAAAEASRQIEIELVAHDPVTGGVDLDDLEQRLSSRTAAVLFDNPSFLGGIEPRAAEIAALARSHGAETIVGVDPLSLGILAPPSDYGADIVVGSTQPLGVHMSCGGGAGGFIATRDDRAMPTSTRPSCSASPRRSPASMDSALPSSSRRRTAAVRRGTTGPGTRSISGRWRTPPTWHCSGQRGSRSSAG